MLWFRRDLRLADSPAVLAAAAAGDPVLALFVLDPVLLKPAGGPRVAYLYRALRALDASVGGRLIVLPGNPSEVVPRVAAELDATTVHVSADFGPYGAARDGRVEAALRAAGRAMVRTGSPYAVPPGRLKRADGTAFRVYSPYLRAWSAHGWPAPAPAQGGIGWIDGGLPRGRVCRPIPTSVQRGSRPPVKKPPSRAGASSETGTCRATPRAATLRRNPVPLGCPCT